MLLYNIRLNNKGSYLHKRLIGARAIISDKIPVYGEDMSLVLKNSFTERGAILWNTLPQGLRESLPKDFKRNLKTYLLQKQQSSDL